MKISFKKYQGTGNDFIMINNMDKSLELSVKEVQVLCDRKYGIGADGLILIEPDETADFYVNYFNSDGTQSFCGNGSRCSVDFAKQEEIIHGNSCTFNAIDGLHSGEIVQDELVKVSMGNVDQIEDLNGDFVLNTGSPHYVKRCNALKELDIITEAHKVRYNDRFKDEGINVNFVEHFDDFISIRTYERGVEDETLSCGTGVTAVALSSAVNEGRHQVTLRTLGGDVCVEFEKSESSFKNIFLIGPAESVFSGLVKLSD